MKGGTIEDNTATYGAGVQNNSHPLSDACAITPTGAIEAIMCGMMFEAGNIQNNTATLCGGGISTNMTTSGSGR